MRMPRVILPTGCEPASVQAVRGLFLRSWFFGLGAATFRSVALVRCETDGDFDSFTRRGP